MWGQVPKAQTRERESATRLALPRTDDALKEKEWRTASSAK